MKLIFLKLFIFTMLFSSIRSSEESIGTMNFCRSVDSNSNSVNVWRSYTTSSNSIQTSTFNANTMEWDNIYEISANDTASNPRVSVKPNGSDISVVIVWTEVKNDVTILYGTMRQNMDSSWSSPVQISNNNYNVQNDITLRMNDSGKIVVTFIVYMKNGLNCLFSATADIENGNVWTVRQVAS